MQKDRIDFIADLLADKRINLPLKEKTFELASKEVKGILSIESENSERILEIERQLSVFNNTSNNGEIMKFEPKTSSNKQNNSPKPSDTKQFLSYFRESEGLKYLTHDFKDLANPIPRKELLSIAKEEFEEAKKKYPKTSEKLILRIEEFAFEENPRWTIRKGEQEITNTHGWSSKDFIEWQENAVVKHPCRSSEWNKKMIEPFKRTIEVRDGLLLELIEESISLAFTKDDLELFEFSYDKNSLLSGRFFTDVDWFGQALYKIFCGIKDKGEKQDCYKISIEYVNNLNDTFKIIKIIHHDSKPMSNSSSKFTDGGNFRDIRNALWSLCNWAIEAEFTNGYRRKFLLWDSNIKQTDTQIKQKEVKGFTHLLLFY